MIRRWKRWDGIETSTSELYAQYHVVPCLWRQHPDLQIVQCTEGDAFTEHGVVEKIFVAKKYLVTPSVFKLQKWGRIQPEIQI